MTSYKRIDCEHEIYHAMDKADCPKTIEIEGKTFYRFMNFFYIPDHVYNLDEEYTASLNDWRNFFIDRVVDYEYNIELHKRMLNSILKYCGTKKSLKVLDFGCGEGMVSGDLIKAFDIDKLFGIDIRAINQEYLYNYHEFKKTKLYQKLPFGENYFDIILALFVFHFKVTDIQLWSSFNSLENDGVLCFNLIKSADKSILDRLDSIGFKMKEKICEPLKEKVIEYYIFRK